mmetsp:Transcript_8664/g.12326  ORF Transcript_8664/g.12326 Transcript_8664/m.12326 type:complete len:128 (+) Transcript_8664:48-431(+)|eukprot:CAMPEP_0184864988 /NCGR_PEP_ID=MMETSP0580-20130426/16551_1 /TAXON_ID=1118495 /ORGANISM="Dactyliosolen fragilissimus" /LENGTH=127 /DNA_ID=CAMNT_0027363973 /DNA_START=37 /DNA_END=420 /DNA_ORIENTATION=+
MFDLISPFDIIPSKYHLPFVALTGFVGFFIVISVSSVVKIQSSSTQPDAPSKTVSNNERSKVKIELPDDSSEMTELTSPSMSLTTAKSTESPKVRKSTRQKSGDLGIISTPAGKRSARIAKKSAKES